MACKSKLETFDMERGDKLTFTRVEAGELSLMGKLAAPVILALLDWFNGAPVPHITHENEDVEIMLNASLARCIGRQKGNAAAYANYLAQQSENAKKRGKIAETKATGEPRQATGEPRQATGKPNINIKQVGTQASSLKVPTMSKNVGPSGVANVAPPGGGTFARTATDADGRTYCEDKFADIGEVRRFVDEREAATHDDEELATDDHKRLLGVFRGTITKRARQLSATPGAFAAVCFDIVAEYCDLTRKASEALARGDTPAFCEASQEVGDTYGENIAKTIMGRLKAKAVALGVDAK